MAGDEADFELYKYKPNVPAAAIFVVLFALLSGYHIWLMSKKRAWFLVPFVIGGLFEFGGYLSRIISAQHITQLTPYIVQVLLLLVAPALYAASIYMILGRIILLTDGEQFALIRRTWLTKIFVTCDVITFLVQCLGGGVMASASDNDPKQIKRGENIVLAGLWLQIAIFGFFVLVAAMFQVKARTHLLMLDASITWKKHLFVLYATSMLILVRSLFRTIEYVQGDDGYLLRHEVFLYIFDACFMVGVMVCMAVVHPGDIAPMLKAKSARGGMEMDSEDERRKDRRNGGAYV